MSQEDEVTNYVIEPVGVAELEEFVTYVADHLTDNGTLAPLFMPLEPGLPWPAEDKLERSKEAVVKAVGESGWRRFWVARAAGAIAGHVDMWGHGAAYTGHRAMLGMGVDRDHRRRGLGRRLLDHAIDWARQQPELDWLDLNVLGSNAPARALYRAAGFVETGCVEDKFRIAGAAVADVSMSFRLR